MSFRKLYTSETFSGNNKFTKRRRWNQTAKRKGSVSTLTLVVAISAIFYSSTSIVLSQQQQQQQQQDLHKNNYHNNNHVSRDRTDLRTTPQAATLCNRVYFGNLKENNIACKCDSAHHCDSFEHFDWPQDDETYLRFTSDLSGLRFHRDELKINKEKKVNANEADEIDFLIELHCDRRAQQVSGFGGAFTDSASEMISSLNEPLKQRLLEDYFGLDGLDYNMGRLPISGTDMSTRLYSYDDLPPGEEDIELKKFKLQEEDFLYKIPLIKQVNLMKSKRNEEALKLIAASWSAPAWMKSNLRLVQGHLIGNSTTGPYYDAYARYIVRFLNEYAERGIRMWGLTPQNEPHTPTRIPMKIKFNSVNFGPKEMADYLANSLVPELLQANYTSDKLKLFIWDDTLDDIELYQRACEESPMVRSYMAGTAIHWYSQALRGKSYSVLNELRQNIIPPDFSLISTEACYIGQPRPGSWERGEGYARDIVENLRAGSVAWIDWNLALNTSGGPTWVHNILDSPILIEPKEQYYIKNPMFYALGHISRFIKPNSYIIPSVVYKKTSKLNFFHNQQSQASWVATKPTDEVTVIAAELDEPLKFNTKYEPDVKRATMERKFSLVLLNRAPQAKQIKLALGSACLAKINQTPLEMKLRPRSITSLAFLC